MRQIVQQRRKSVEKVLKRGCFQSKLSEIRTIMRPLSDRLITNWDKIRHFEYKIHHV